MKNLIVLILLLPFALTAQKSDIGWLFINENTIELDKQQHALAGMFLGTTAYFIAYEGKPENRQKAKIWGIATSLVVGTLKEVTDIKTTGFDTEDLAYTVAGGVLATYTFDFFVHRANKREAKRNKVIAMTDNFYKQ